MNKKNIKDEEKPWIVNKENNNPDLPDVFERGQLTIDIYQTPNEIIIESPISGIKSKDLVVAINNDKVVIQGERKRENKIEEKDFLYQECYYGKFSRTILLPQKVDAKKAVTDFKNGILKIKLPKLNK